MYTDQIAKAAVLIEALPYLQNFRGSTILIKVGGSAMEDANLVKSLLRDVVFMEVAGMKPIIVHGGGKFITEAMRRAKLTPRFIHGLRVTDSAAIKIVEKTLDEEINPSLVASINAMGGKAAGVSGKKIFQGIKATPREINGKKADLGYVGEIDKVLEKKIQEILHNETVPVISPLALGLEKGSILNINADTAASALAGKIKADKIVFLSDVLGVQRRPEDPESLLPSLQRKEVEKLIEQNIIMGGMLPKVRAALDALTAGVQKAHLIDGRIKHSLLLEIFTEQGVGTEILA